jgi:hypothetical protein
MCAPHHFEMVKNRPCPWTDPPAHFEAQAPLPKAPMPEEIRAAIASVQGMLGALLRMWPEADRGELVLWVLYWGPGRSGASFQRRGDVLRQLAPEPAQRVREMRDDSPVVVHLGRPGGVAVLPWRSLLSS